MGVEAVLEVVVVAVVAAAVEGVEGGGGAILRHALLPQDHLDRGHWPRSVTGGVVKSRTDERQVHRSIEAYLRYFTYWYAGLLHLVVRAGLVTQIRQDWPLTWHVFPGDINSNFKASNTSMHDFHFLSNFRVAIDK